MTSVYQRPFSGYYFIVLGEAGGKRYSRSLWDETLELSSMPSLSPGKTHHWQARGPMDQQLLMRAATFRKQGQQVTLVVAEDVSPLLASLQRINWIFAGLAFLVLCLLLLLQGFIVRRSFRPLQQIRQEIKNLQQGAVGELTNEVPAEVRPLVREINHLLALSVDRLQRSRNALGNLAHALKTPLSVLTQLSQRDELRALPTLSHELQRNTETIGHLMDRELKRARLMGQGVPGKRFSPVEELPVLVDVLQRVYSDKSLDIQWCIQPDSSLPLLMFDRDDMLELLGNLLDNACKWAQQRVVCTLQGDQQNLQLRVEDDGPGCTVEEISRLTTRGVRVDESVSGHGLGLAIVRDIVELYEGELRFAMSDALGGLQVSVVVRAQSTVK
ncbi:MAG: sensor histidine kinase [Gammaproteobacteria bacterium]|nr:sensor histidine kinase [Gammaproteobacteria bacterium]